MGLFSGLGGTKTYPNNEPEAVLGILLSVIAADGDISDDESESFMYLANNTKSLGPMSASTFKENVNTCLGLLRREGPPALMEKCAPHVTDDKRGSLFINACDLIMRDGRIEREEEQLVEALQHQLRLDDAFARNAVGVILAKYNL